MEEHSRKISQTETQLEGIVENDPPEVIPIGKTIHARFIPKSNIRSNYQGVEWNRGRRK